MTNPSLKELGNAFATEFKKSAKDVIDSWSDADKAALEETFVDAARVAALSLLDPETAKMEMGFIEATLKNFKVAASFSIVSGFWNAVKAVLAVVAPILLKSLMAVLL